MVRTIRWIMTPLLAAVLLAACASDPDDGGGVASLDDAATPTASASPSVDPEEALQAFAECMRENGIEDFPDPQIDADGGIQIQAPGGPGSFDRGELDAAMAACQDLLPSGLGPGDGEGPSAEEQAELEDAFLAYAQCMREHGIDMPDPQFDGGGVIQDGGDFDPASPEFQQADEACAHHLEDAGIGFGEAPDGS